MTPSEREMVQHLTDEPTPQERFTSLQPTYEDSVPPESAWPDEEDYRS